MPVIDLAQKLLARPSVTPDEAGCMAVLQAALEPSGFAFEIERTPNGTTNAWITHGNGAPLFVFAGHVDVVPAGDPALWTTPPFEPTVRDGKLYARGAADMKGSVAAAAVAFARLVQEKPDHPGTLAFLITSDEEGDGYEGTKRVVQKLKDEGVTIDACIVGEPSCSRFFGDTIKNGRRGSLNGKITIRGKAGHVAYPHLARNPIHEAAPFLPNSLLSNGIRATTTSVRPPSRFPTFRPALAPSMWSPENSRRSLTFDSTPSGRLSASSRPSRILPPNTHLTRALNGSAAPNRL